jgi:hypothetical protein
MRLKRGASSNERIYQAFKSFFQIYFKPYFTPSSKKTSPVSKILFSFKKNVWFGGAAFLKSFVISQLMANFSPPFTKAKE